MIVTGTIVIIPCYKRPEYTAKCIRAIEEAQEYDDVLFYLVDDGSMDGTEEILKSAKLKWKQVIVNSRNMGLRNCLVAHFLMAENFEYMVKMDNDCVVPKNWLNDTLKLLKENKADILSPNVNPSNAAFVHGKDDTEGLGYRPSKIVGGLWAMRSEMLRGINFEGIPTARGISGACSLLNQIIVEKEPRIGWLTNVTVQDIGHWSGKHPEHIASDEHREYSAEVGRPVSW